jgi:transcriptional regulator with XRE-family HTH domain
MFGNFIKQERLALGLSLRRFCQKLELDPSNWSKVERGILPPPKDEVFLERLAGLLQIEVGSPKWQELSDLAHVDRGEIPEYVMQDQELVELLPILFRTIDSIKPTRKEIIQLLESIKEAHK